MGKSRKTDSHRQAISKRTVNGIIQGLLITVVIAFLFYRSIFGLIVGIVVVPFWLKLCQEKYEMDEKARVSVEFKEYMMLIVTALQTGYSLEKALKQSEKELLRLYPKNSAIINPVNESEDCYEYTGGKCFYGISRKHPT